MNVAVHAEHLNILSICTGGGGLDLGVELAIRGARSVCMVEREAFPVAQLVSAMEAGLMAPAPIWSDARTFNGRAWRGAVDGLIGGIPCQPHSVAGKRLGDEDERDLWSTARRVIVQSGVWFVLIENVRGMLSSGGAERVWRDLRRLGFEVEGGLFTASEVGASHERERFFILAVADNAFRRRGGGSSSSTKLGHQVQNRGSSGELVDAPSLGRRERWPEPEFRSWRDTSSSASQSMDDASIARGRPISIQPGGQYQARFDAHGAISIFPPGPGDIHGWLATLEGRPDVAPVLRAAVDVADANGELRGYRHDGENGDAGLPQDGTERGRVTISSSGFRRAKSGFRRVADGVANRVDRLRMLGNGVVPLEAAYAVRTLCTRLAARGSSGAAKLVRMMEIAS